MHGARYGLGQGGSRLPVAWHGEQPRVGVGIGMGLRVGGAGRVARRGMLAGAGLCAGGGSGCSDSQARLNVSVNNLSCSHLLPLPESEGFRVSRGIFWGGHPQR